MAVEAGRPVRTPRPLGVRSSRPASLLVRLDRRWRAHPATLEPARRRTQPAGPARCGRYRAEVSGVPATIRPWNGPADTTAMQRLASRLWPLGLHPGGLGWSAAIGQLADQILLAEQPHRLVGWAGITGTEISLAADPAAPDAAGDLVAAIVDLANAIDVTVTLADRDTVALEVVTSAGFRLDPEAGLIYGMSRPATMERPELPTGYRIRPVAEEEFDARVAVHRAAWRPVTLPFPAEVAATISPLVTSRFTAEHYAKVRQTYLYDPALDLVCEAPDGSLAACCIAWWAADLGVAEIEPLGIVPEHRRRGLAGAMCLQVAALVHDLGGSEVFINTGPSPDYPVPALTYAKVGFTATARARSYRRVRSKSR
jgi:GNAT superfamily N-acetyltransferase